MGGELIPKLKKITSSFIIREFQAREWAKGLHFIW